MTLAFPKDSDVAKFMVDVVGRKWRPIQPSELPQPGERWELHAEAEAMEWGLKKFAVGPLTIEQVGASNVYARTDKGIRGVLTIRQLLTFWRREAPST